MNNSGNRLRGIVLHHRHMVYWPVPKAACSTLKAFFATELTGKKYKFEDVHGDKLPFEYTWDVIPEYFNFTYVRNPFERFLSVYNEKIVMRIDRKVFPNEALFWHKMPFHIFLTHCIETLSKDRHYMPQTELIPDGVHCYKMERDLWLKMLMPLNKSIRVDWWTPDLKKIAYEFYRNDFIRYGYHFNPYSGQEMIS